MPIRFRCAYCNQLMSIARRKAGAVVRCPNPRCAGDIIVPTPDEPSPLPGGRPVHATFEDQKLERLLDASSTQPAASEVPDQAALLGAERTFGDPEALNGLYLPRGILVAAILAVLALLGLAFVVGFLAGRA